MSGLKQRLLKSGMPELKHKTARAEFRARYPDAQAMSAKEYKASEEWGERFAEIEKQWKKGEEAYKVDFAAWKDEHRALAKERDAEEAVKKSNRRPKKGGQEEEEQDDKTEAARPKHKRARAQPESSSDDDEEDLPPSKAEIARHETRKALKKNRNFAKALKQFAGEDLDSLLATMREHAAVVEYNMQRTDEFRQQLKVFIKASEQQDISNLDVIKHIQEAISATVGGGPSVEELLGPALTDDELTLQPDDTM